MMDVLPVLLKDGYKVGHPFQYERDTTLVYSNVTPRMSRVPSAQSVVAFGFQYFAHEYLIRQFTENFFEQPLGRVMDRYKRRISHYLGPLSSYQHIADLHALGYLPLLVKAVPEGSLVPLRVPMLTIRNTHPEFFWLTNMVESLMSNVLWMPVTSATTALAYRRQFEHWAAQTGGDPSFVKWQGHDFSFRGLPGLEAAMLSGAAHLLSFTGTDTIPAIDFLEHYYFADCEQELIGGSVPATEHSVMSMGRKESEQATFERLIGDVYPAGIVSIVSDTWDLWQVLTEYVPALRDKIMARDGKVVFRPDSGDPVKILCGDPDAGVPAVRQGVVECLWQQFPGPLTAKGFKQLDPHVGTIYGDSITPDRQDGILRLLFHKGFASTNVVLGIGSYTYQYVTRDTFGQALKATYGETKSRGGQAIWKSPVTDDGTKYSATGLLRVDNVGGKLVLRENVTWDEEAGGVLEPIFENGQMRRMESLAMIRARIDGAVQS